MRNPLLEVLIDAGDVTCVTADHLRLCSEAYARWNDPRYLAAAKSSYAYMMKALAAPDGGFYAMRAPGLSAGNSNPGCCEWTDAARGAADTPSIDRQEYACETGWSIRALCKYYDITGETGALAAADRAARWAISNRSISGGGFSHAGDSDAKLYLDDSLAMAGAFVALYRSTGENDWLARGAAALDFVDAYLRDKRAGFHAAPRRGRTHAASGELIRGAGPNAELVRIANLLEGSTGEVKYRRIAVHGMQHLAAYAAADPAAQCPTAYSQSCGTEPHQRVWSHGGSRLGTGRGGLAQPR